MLAAALVSCRLRDSADYCPGQQAGNQQAEDSNLGPVKLVGDSQTIDNKDNCPGGTGVQVFWNQQADLSPGGEYTLTLDVTTCGNAYQRKNAAWIDFNGNQKYDDWEKIGEQDVGATPGDNILSFKFKVPATSSKINSSNENVAWLSPDGKNNTMLRVMVVENGFDPMDPCLQFPYGGLKDFPILIGGSGGALDGGAIFLLILFCGGLVGLLVITLVFWKVKQVAPKDFLTESVLGPIKTFFGLVKSGVMFMLFKCKCSKKGESGDYEEL